VIINRVKARDFELDIIKRKMHCNMLIMKVLYGFLIFIVCALGLGYFPKFFQDNADNDMKFVFWVYFFLSFPMILIGFHANKKYKKLTKITLLKFNRMKISILKEFEKYLLQITPFYIIVVFSWITAAVVSSVFSNPGYILNLLFGIIITYGVINVFIEYYRRKDYFKEINKVIKLYTRYPHFVNKIKNIKGLSYFKGFMQRLLKDSFEIRNFQKSKK
jgi:hypothetical protein